MPALKTGAAGVTLIPGSDTGASIIFVGYVFGRRALFNRAGGGLEAFSFFHFFTLIVTSQDLAAGTFFSKGRW